MGRPRQEGIPTEQRWCAVQGMLTTWRLYRNGTDSAGKQQSAWFCLPCRAEKNLQHYHNNRSKESA